MVPPLDVSAVSSATTAVCDGTHGAGSADHSLSLPSIHVVYLTEIHAAYSGIARLPCPIRELVEDLMPVCMQGTGLKGFRLETVLYRCFGVEIRPGLRLNQTTQMSELDFTDDDGMGVEYHAAEIITRCVGHVLNNLS